MASLPFHKWRIVPVTDQTWTCSYQNNNKMPWDISTYPPDLFCRGWGVEVRAMRSRQWCVRGEGWEVRGNQWGLQSITFTNNYQICRLRAVSLFALKIALVQHGFLQQKERMLAVYQIYCKCPHLTTNVNVCKQKANAVMWIMCSLVQESGLKFTMVYRFVALFFLLKCSTYHLFQFWVPQCTMVVPMLA